MKPTESEYDMAVKFICYAKEYPNFFDIEKFFEYVKKDTSDTTGLDDFDICKLSFLAAIILEKCKMIRVDESGSDYYGTHSYFKTALGYHICSLDDPIRIKEEIKYLAKIFLV